MKIDTVDSIVQNQVLNCIILDTVCKKVLYNCTQYVIIYLYGKGEIMKGQVKLRREVFNAINDYVKHLQIDYASHSSITNSRLIEMQDQMIKDFEDSLVLKKDKEFTRVIVRGSIHSFIVMEDKGRLKRGDILRGLNRTKPDTSFSHGNVLEGKYEKISWSGI